MNSKDNFWLLCRKLIMERRIKEGKPCRKKKGKKMDTWTTHGYHTEDIFWHILKVPYVWLEMKYVRQNSALWDSVTLAYFILYTFPCPQNTGKHKTASAYLTEFQFSISVWSYFIKNKRTKWKSSLRTLQEKVHSTGYWETEVFCHEYFTK